MGMEMRQMDKIKEKIIIRLDDREVAWLVIGCLMIAAGVFTAGFYMGSDMSPLPSNDSLAVLPDSLQKAPTAKNEETDEVADLQYTYDNELTTPTPLEKIDDPALEIIAKFKDKIVDSPQNEDVEGPDLALAGPRPALKASSAFAGDELKGAPVGHLSPVKAPSPAMVPRWANKRSNQPTPGTKGSAPPSSARANGYTIQIRAFRKEKDAAGFAQALRKSGYKPYVVAAEVPGRGTYYRVRLGKFTTLAVATSTQAKFERAESYSTIVTPL